MLFLLFLYANFFRGKEALNSVMNMFFDNFVIVLNELIIFAR